MSTPCFVTVCYGILNHKTGAIDFTNAGHTPAYILQTNGQVKEVEQYANFVAGGIEDFPYRSNTTRLEPGEAIVLYTDGVTEAFNETQEEFGVDRLKSSLTELCYADAATVISGVHDDLRDFIRETEQSDDITMLVIKRKKI